MSHKLAITCHLPVSAKLVAKAKVSLLDSRFVLGVPQYFQEMDDAEDTLHVMYENLERAINDQDFKTAADLKLEMDVIHKKDVVEQVLTVRPEAAMPCCLPPQIPRPMPEPQ